MDVIFGLFCLLGVFAAIAAQLWLQIAWGRRDTFWRHHDHLIPPTPRSPRSAP